MRIAAGACWALLWAAACGGEPVPAGAADETGALMAEMAGERAQFDVEKLRRLGRAGLARVLDRLLPQTAAGAERITREEAARLVEDLGSQDFEVREAATTRLSADGLAHRDLVAAAAKSEDLEVRTRVAAVLEALRKVAAEDLKRMKADVAPYYDAMLVCLQGLEDEEFLLELAGRTCSALSRGASESQRALLRRFLSAIARSRRDAPCRQLAPLLEHEDEATAVWVVGAIGANSPDGHFPPLLLAALGSKRRAVVAEALDWTPGCRDAARRDEVRKLVGAIFDGDDEGLKFEACFPLMRDFGDARALEYLLEQAGNSDWKRARTALLWIGNACNAGKPPAPKLVETIGPMLSSEDADRRRAAVGALGPWRGAEVVSRLVPRLADENRTIAREAAAQLSRQADREALVRLLTEAAEKDESEAVRTGSAELLKELEPGK